MKRSFTVSVTFAALLLQACGADQSLVEPDPRTAYPAEFELGRELRESALELARADEYDDQLCITAQHMILNSGSDDFTVHLQRGEGNAFHMIQMGIVPEAQIVRIAMTTLNSGPLGFDTHVACKMVNRDRVNDQLHLRLRGDDISCRDVNELTYVTALNTLASDELRRYLDAGKPLRFVDDYVTAGGGEWIPSAIDDFIHDVPGEYLEVQAPSVRVPWNKAEHVFFQGTHHCKLITLAAMQRWMNDGALRDADRLFPPTRMACVAPSATLSKVGSCLFYFAPAAASFCQDYTGSGWTVDAARAECAQRHANAEALRDAQGDHEGTGGAFSSVTCANRTDVGPITGTCVFNCATPDESLWQLSTVGAIDPIMTRACDLFISSAAADPD